MPAHIGTSSCDYDVGLMFSGTFGLVAEDLGRSMATRRDSFLVQAGAQSISADGDRRPALEDNHVLPNCRSPPI